MNLFESRGIVLKTQAYGEADLIVAILDDTGKLSRYFAPRARQSKKRFAGMLDLFNALVFQCPPQKMGSMPRLNSAELLRDSLQIRSQMTAFAGACYLSEMILEFLPDGLALPAVYEVFEAYLEESGKTNGQSFFTTQLKLLSLFGFELALDCCVLCREELREESVYIFAPERGGICCQTCASQGNTRTGELSLLKINALLVQKAASSACVNFRALGPSIKNVESRLQSFIEETSGKTFKSRDFLNSVLWD